MTLLLQSTEFDWRVQKEYPMSESGFFQFLNNAWKGLSFTFKKTVEKMLRICKVTIKSGSSFNDKSKIWRRCMIIFYIKRKRMRGEGKRERGIEWEEDTNWFYAIVHHYKQITCILHLLSLSFLMVDGKYHYRCSQI